MTEFWEQSKDELLGLEHRLGKTFFTYQWETFEHEIRTVQAGVPPRCCLYYRTGAGKSLTSLVQMRLWGELVALVIAPPSTHDTWYAQAAELGMDIECISHAKFRDKGYKVSRLQPIIADEMHLFGGHRGKGWLKLDTLARHLQAPLILASATPSYNDAERVYCVQHVLDPHSCKGGFLEFLYRNCETEQDPFSQTPKVLGFLNYPDAEAYLAALPHVHYVPDTLVYTINDIDVPAYRSDVLDDLGYDERSHRMMASIIEEKHKRIFYGLVNEVGSLELPVVQELDQLLVNRKTPVLVFANHATVAVVADRGIANMGFKVGLVTGDTPKKKKAGRIDAFRDGVLDVLVGTASLATGTDGLDKVCDTLIILDDTDDDSLRRQLIGRIMPRGADADASKKRVHRIVLT